VASGDSKGRRDANLRALLAGALAVGISSVLLPPLSEADVILQFFESSYRNTEHRMPDIFMAGYNALWIPPPGRAACADCASSVGYDPFDRFDLGSSGKPTLYGTREQLQRSIREAHKANVAVYVDTVLNHNGFSNLGTPGFIESGGYPGFVVSLPQDVDGDFHNGFLTTDQPGHELDGRLGGEIDIAQDKNHRFIRQPVDPGDARNIPVVGRAADGRIVTTGSQLARDSNRQFYPDVDPASPATLGNTAADRHTPSGFNLDRPQAGDPVEENATGLLLRYCKWMVEVVGVDGFRLDAAKHVPTFFWNDFFDQAVFHIGSGGTTPYSFGEVIAGGSADDLSKLRSYTRKDGFGNRDVLDFPLFFTMRNVLNGTGNGSMRALERASVDIVDGDPNDGSIGVQFVQNHDGIGEPPAASNIAYAHILTRNGYPIVYFNAREFTPPNFPREGRGDALGGQFGTIIATLVDIHHSYRRGRHLTRFIDDDVYVYELDRSMIVGLNDNKHFDADRTIQTSFPEGTTLVELTGNPHATAPLLVGRNGTAVIKIPSDANDLGYAVWGPKAPSGATSVAPLMIAPVASVISPEGPDVPNGLRRITPIERLTANNATLTLTLLDEDLDDRAFVRIDNGGINVIGTEIFASGEFKGFQTFTTSDPGATGRGVYSATLDLSKLQTGNHYIEVVAFLKREASLPPIFRTFRKVIFVQR
jgi:alpha-amylase